MNGSTEQAEDTDDSQITETGDTSLMEEQPSDSATIFSVDDVNKEPTTFSALWLQDLFRNISSVCPELRSEDSPGFRLDVCHYPQFVDQQDGYWGGLFMLENVFIDKTVTHIVHVPSRKLHKKRGCAPKARVQYSMNQLLRIYSKLTDQTEHADLEVIDVLDNGHEVRFIDQSISFLHIRSSNTFHILIEVLPRLLLAKPIYLSMI